MCQSIQQQTPDGKSCVGGEPSTRREERRKGNCGRHRQNPSPSCVMRMLLPTERRMSLTGVNEEPGWFPCLPMFPTHTCSLTFFIELLQMIPKQLHVAGWQALPFVLNMCETMGKACACFMPPPRRKNAYPFAVHVRFGISRSTFWTLSSMRGLQEWRECILQSWYKNVKTRKCSHSEQKLFMCFL